MGLPEKQFGHCVPRELVSLFSLDASNQTHLSSQSIASPASPGTLMWDPYPRSFNEYPGQQTSQLDPDIHLWTSLLREKGSFFHSPCQTRHDHHKQHDIKNDNNHVKMDIILIYENRKHHHRVLLKALEIDTSPLRFSLESDFKMIQMNWISVWTENSNLSLSKKGWRNTVMWSGFYEFYNSWSGKQSGSF